MTTAHSRLASLCFVLATLLALVLPGVAAAQAAGLTSSAYVGIETAEDAEVPPDLDEASDVALDDDDAGEITGRTFAGLGLGVGTLVTATGLGLAIGLAVPHNCGSGAWICFSSEAPTGAAFGFAVGTALLPAAYTLGASLAGGRGHAGGSYLGFVVGAAAGAGMISLGVVANESLRNDAGAGLLGTSLALGIAAPLVGMAIGYEISDAAAPPIVPTMAFDGSGASFGVAGSF